MPDQILSEENRQQAELQFAEIVGRLHACEHLENAVENMDDYRVLYGWNMLTQEVLIRVAEAALKLIYQIHFDDKPPHGHSLKALWDKIPRDVQQEIEANRGQTLSFAEYDAGSFQDVRYSAERLKGGRTVAFEIRQLYLDSLAATSVAEEWLGNVTTWPWAGILDQSLSGYKVVPIDSDSFEVWINDPIQPLDWAGAIIKAKDDLYIWTLYFGFVAKNGERAGYELPGLAYPWPMEELLADSVVGCVEKIHQAYQEPARALVEALQEARRAKWPGVTI